MLLYHRLQAELAELRMQIAGGADKEGDNGMFGGFTMPSMPEMPSVPGMSSSDGDVVSKKEGGDGGWFSMPSIPKVPGMPGSGSSSAVSTPKPSTGEGKDALRVELDASKNDLEVLQQELNDSRMEADRLQHDLADSQREVARLQEINDQEYTPHQQAELEVSKSAQQRCASCITHSYISFDHVAVLTGWRKSLW